VGDERTRIILLTVSKGEAFWITVIGLALAAIVAGFMSGASTARLPEPGTATSHVQPSVHAVLRDPSDAAIDDVFSADDVVVERREVAVATNWSQPTLSIVVGLCGYANGDDELFIHSALPIAVDIDPDAPEAASVAERAREARDVVLVHLGDAPTQAQLARLRRRLGDFDGLASRAPDRFVQALDGTGLLFFDERGDADASEFRTVDIPFAQRDVTVDDRTGAGYIRFMLERTAQRSARQGPMVVLMRPQPHSFQALNALAAARTARFVPLTQRP
jgi:polysaccharide deacetylase 2 family uncharacterized protein YibQ